MGFSADTQLPTSEPGACSYHEIQVPWAEICCSFSSKICLPIAFQCAEQNGNQKDWTLLSKEQLWEKLGGCEALGRQIKGKLCGNTLWSNRKFHHACKSVIDSEGNLLGTERGCVCWSTLKQRTQKGSRTNIQTSCQIIGIKILFFPHLLNYLAASRKILHLQILCGNTTMKRNLFFIISFHSFLSIWGYVRYIRFYPSIFQLYEYNIYMLSSIHLSILCPSKY